MLKSDRKFIQLCQEMLRYFYILVCTRLCFCYDYIENEQLRRKNSENEDTKREISRVIQFDVASFLRNTKGSHEYEPSGYRYKNLNEHTQSDYYYDSPLNENIKKRDENTIYLNTDTDDPNDNPTKEDRLDPNPQSFGKIRINEGNLIQTRENKVKNEQNELLTDKDLIQNSKKQCAFKDMKVPFFSREPYTVQKQKRKLFCANCTKPYTNDVSKSKIKNLNNKIKRAYVNLCPKCIRKLIKNNNIEKYESVKQIHGSREFYQNIVTPQQYNQNEKQPIKDIFEEYFPVNDRVKRGESEERERQLKELAEVEKKVDHVIVTTPKFIIAPLDK